MYTDGACSGNPGPGGWAWVEPDGGYRSGAEAHTTNQRMEITAALEAVRDHPGPLEVVSDSTYVVHCFRDRWWEGWRRRGWVNAKKEPVKNRDLWEPLIDLVVGRGDVTFRWVKAHDGDRWNDLADRLAVEAAAAQEGRSGDRPPDTTGPADATGPGSTRAEGRDSRADRLPAGRRVAIFGHRPPELGGYDANPIAEGVREKLAEILAAKRAVHDDLLVVSGLQLGAETLGAEAALEVGLPLVVVLGYPDFDGAWPAATREHFRSLSDRADEVIVLERKVPDTKAKIGAALRRRDAWLARQVDEAVLVWDERDPVLGKLARTLDEQLAEDVWYLAPGEASRR